MDREKVIKGVHDARRYLEDRELVDKSVGVHIDALNDAIELLKEQEAIKPILIREGRNKNYNDYVCPRCDNVVAYEQNYCSECGVRFLWEGR
jgi:hypothetical protein